MPLNLKRSGACRQCTTTKRASLRATWTNSDRIDRAVNWGRSRAFDAGSSLPTAAVVQGKREGGPTTVGAMYAVVAPPPGRLRFTTGCSGALRGRAYSVNGQTTHTTVSGREAAIREVDQRSGGHAGVKLLEVPEGNETGACFGRGGLSVPMVRIPRSPRDQNHART
jgi:hypothetical protein